MTRTICPGKSENEGTSLSSSRTRMPAELAISPSSCTDASFSRPRCRRRRADDGDVVLRRGVHRSRRIRARDSFRLATKIADSRLEHVHLVADAIAHEPHVGGERGEIGDGVDDAHGDGRASRVGRLRERREVGAELRLDRSRSGALGVGGRAGGGGVRLERAPRVHLGQRHDRWSHARRRGAGVGSLGGGGLGARRGAAAAGGDGSERAGLLQRARVLLERLHQVGPAVHQGLGGSHGRGLAPLGHLALDVELERLDVRRVRHERLLVLLARLLHREAVPVEREVEGVEVELAAQREGLVGDDFGVEGVALRLERILHLGDVGHRVRRCRGLNLGPRESGREGGCQV